MALSEFEKAIVKKKLDPYCRRRVPPRARDEVRLKYSFRGDSVTLYEERPTFFDVSDWVKIPIAQFRFDSINRSWALYWPDRNSRWHEYDDIMPSDDLDTLLDEVEADPTGVFWG